MATLASTNVTTGISANAEQPIAYGDSGLLIEFFRCQGGAAADTVALTPRWITDIRHLTANLAVTDNLSYTQANTNVTLTLAQSAASTSVQFSAAIIGRR